MSEAVKVIVKCRPMNRQEQDMECLEVLEISSNTGQCSITNPDDRKMPPKIFTFDGAYDAESTNEQVYLDIAFPLVEGVTEGYHGTIFAYGQTGCGKTFTMQGIDEPAVQRGLIPFAFHHIFDTVAVAENTRYLIHASFLEIYNEEVRDLLGANTKARLELKERPDGAVFVKDLSMHVVQCVRDCEAIMMKGWKHRATGSTLMNAQSSRSHSIFTIHLERCDETEDGSTTNAKIRASKLNLVDLAGSERQSKTGATGDRLKEATKINLSLSALGNVISALVDSRSTHVPYRDSKLTRLLQDSLGGNTKTLMIACLAPGGNNYEETLSTLRYANRAKNIKNKPRINEDPKDALIRQYLDEINRLKEMLNSNPPVDALPKPQPAEPHVVEKIIHVPIIDEAEVHAKTKAIADEYEIRIQKMAAELAEARADRQKTESEMERLRVESEEKQRKMYAEYLAQTELMRQQLQQEFEQETERVSGELEAVKRSKELVLADMETLRRQFDSALSSVEQSVPPQDIDAERKRLNAEYEANMNFMRDELEAVKKSRADIETEMVNLRASYEVRLRSGGQSATGSTTTASDVSQRQNLTDEMKLTYDELGRVQQTVKSKTAEIPPKESAKKDSDDEIRPNTEVAANQLEKRTESANKEAELQAKLVVVHEKLDRFSEHMAKIKQEEWTANADTSLADPMITEAMQRQAAEANERSVAAIDRELESFKQTRDKLADDIHKIKVDYRDAVNRATEVTPWKRLAEEQASIRAAFEAKMDRVKDDLKVLKSQRNVALKQREDCKIVWEYYQSESVKLDDDLQAGKMDYDVADDEKRKAVRRYRDEMQRLQKMAQADKENVQTQVVNDRFEREQQRITDDLQAGQLTDAEANARLADLAQSKAMELRVLYEQARSRSPTVIEGVFIAESALSTGASAKSVPVSASKTKQKSTTDESPTETPTPARVANIQSSEEAVRRLNCLERALIHGGACANTCSADSKSAQVEAAHCRFIREKLQREKLHAAEKHRKQQEALRSKKTSSGSELADAYASAQDELVAKTKALEHLRLQNESLQQEIRDIGAEFENDRIDYIDSIRKQNQYLKWFQAVVDKIIPALRRDANYVNMEKIWAQSEWDDLNQCWNVPSFSVDKTLTLPPVSPATGYGGWSASVEPSSSSTSDLDFDLRSEDRFIEKLNESALRDPAAYFRPQTRADSVMAERRDRSAGSEMDRPRRRDQQVSLSPLLRRPRQH